MNKTTAANEINQKAAATPKMLKNPWVITIVLIILIAGIVGGIIYWQTVQLRVAIDKAQIIASKIDLAPQGSGILQNVFVNEGDLIPANTTVAQVGNELIKTKISSVVITTRKNVGKLVNRGEAVVTVINPQDMRVVGQVEEDKGLNKIQIGQKAIFTADAFGSKEYEGVVDEVSPTSREGDIVFNISDKRQVSQFNIKVRFDINQYPELKNGMSAKAWIYK